MVATVDTKEPSAQKHAVAMEKSSTSSKMRSVPQYTKIVVALLFLIVQFKVIHLLQSSDWKG